MSPPSYLMTSCARHVTELIMLIMLINEVIYHVSTQLPADQLCKACIWINYVN